MTGLSRREFLGAAALAAAVPSPDVFELRVRWCSISVQPTTDPLLAAARGYVRTGDPALGRRAAADLDAYRRRYYRADQRPRGNWWPWQIGIPKRLLDAAVLVSPYLGAEQIAGLAESVNRFVPESRVRDYSGTSTAANRVDLCLVLMLLAVLTGDRAKASLAVRALSPVFRYVSEGDGFYRDGSFIQHSTVPYQGEYGVVLLSGLAKLFRLVEGTPWDVTDPQRGNVRDFVQRSFAPFVHEGYVMDLVRGRALTRQPGGGRRGALRLGDALQLLGESIAERPGHVLMPRSARAVHRSARGWVAALSMSSYRVARYEHGNGENPRGWHTGDGMLYWWAEGHREQYAGTFWQTVDPYRLPGTTVSTRRLPDGAGKPWGDNCPDARWVGGVTDGTYAAVGQHLLGLESSLEAFKSWFFLDDAVVCLGAGISCSDGVPVETVVDNRRAAGPLAVHPGWAHLEGHGGYVVRDGRLRAQRGGAYVTLWLDHGVDPGGGAYAYLLMPGATADETRARAWDPGWAVILANSAAQQAIRVPSLDLTAVNFWQPGTVAGLTADAPCAVLIGGNTVTVADVREDLDSLTLSWNTGRKVTIPLNNQRRIWRIPG